MPEIELQHQISGLIQRAESLRHGIGNGLSSEDINDRLLELELSARILRLGTGQPEMHWKAISFTIRMEDGQIQAEESSTNDDFSEAELGAVYDTLRRLHVEWKRKRQAGQAS
jgi:hypothetical protein